MNKKELIQMLGTQSHNKSTVKELVNLLFSTITECLVAGEKITIHEFGSFSVKTKAARNGRNPATGAEIKIPEKVVVIFKPHKILKDSLNS